MDDSLKTKEEYEALKRNSRYVNALAFLALLLLMIAVLVYLFEFTLGQIEANRAITDVALTAKELMEKGESVSGYTAIISDMQAVQQAYSQSASTNMLSVVYAVVTAVILGYGVKVIRHNEEDRQKILLTEAGLRQADKKLSESAELAEKIKAELNVMKAETNLRFMESNQAYIATTSCRNAAYICTLLQSHIALQLQNNGAIDLKSRRIMEGLQVDLINSLWHFLGFLQTDERALTPEILKALKYSWGLAKDSLHAYIEADGPDDVALVTKFFPDDAETLLNLCNEIDERFKKR